MVCDERQGRLTIYLTNTNQFDKVRRPCGCVCVCFCECVHWMYVCVCGNEVGECVCSVCAVCVQSNQKCACERWMGDGRLDVFIFRRLISDM